MFPRTYIAGSLHSSYYLALLAGILVGWVAFVLSEEPLWKEKGIPSRFRTFTVSSFYYFIIMVCCIQGATYFHLFSITFPPTSAAA